jgi:hypothetical protein
VPCRRGGDPGPVPVRCCSVGGIRVQLSPRPLATILQHELRSGTRAKQSAVGAGAPGDPRGTAHPLRRPVSVGLSGGFLRGSISGPPALRRSSRPPLFNRAGVSGLLPPFRAAPGSGCPQNCASWRTTSSPSAWSADPADPTPRVSTPSVRRPDQPAGHVDARRQFRPGGRELRDRLGFALGAC